MTLPYISQYDPITQLFILAFGLSVIFGVFARKTEFCPLGGLADVMHSGNSGRIRMYFFAIATAMVGMTLLEAFQVVNLDEARPPYRMSQFRWMAFALGGLFFGIGMTMCRGCGMKNMLNFGSGNLKAIVAILGMGSAAVLMLYMEGFFEAGFLSWILPLSPDLAPLGYAKSDLGTLAAVNTGMQVDTLRIVIGLALPALLVIWVFRSEDFRARLANPVGGFVIGACIVGAYYLSGGEIGQAAMEASDFMDQPQNGMGLQSYTFIRPMGDMLYVAANPEYYLVTIGLVMFLGVGAGSLLISLLTLSFRLQWFSSIGEAVRYLVGGVLVGIGGILGLGCTLGQGLAGTSTLAAGSFINLASLLFGAWIGIKLQPGFMSDHEVPGQPNGIRDNA